MIFEKLGKIVLSGFIVIHLNTSKQFFFSKKRQKKKFIYDSLQKAKYIYKECRT